MGNTSTSSGNNLLDSRFKFQEKIMHSCYGEISLMKDEEADDYVAIKELIFQNETECQKEITALKQQAKRSHECLIKVLKFKLLSENNLCSSVFKVAYMLEYYQRDLAFEIATRRIQKAPFHEGEIWFLLINVVSALTVLQSNYVSHGSLTTNNIFITNNGLVKIAETSVMKTLNNYAQALSGVRTKGVYLSPELMNCLKEKNWSPCCDYFKSDVFTFGVILLEVCSLKTSDDIYNYLYSEFNAKLMELRLEDVKKNVGAELAKIIEAMLQIDLHRRPDFLQLLQMIGQNRAKQMESQQKSTGLDFPIKSDPRSACAGNGANLATESDCPTDIKRRPPALDIKKATPETDKEKAQIEKGILLSGKREKKEGNFSPEPLATFNYNSQTTTNRKLDLNTNEVNFIYEGSMKSDSMMSPTFNRGTIPEIKELKLNTDSIDHTFNSLKGKELECEDAGEMQYCYYTKEQLENWKKAYNCLPEEEAKQPKAPGERGSFLNQSNDYGYKEGQSELVYIMNSFNFENKTDHMFNQSSIFRHSKNPSSNFSPSNLRADKLLGAISPVKKGEPSSPQGKRKEGAPEPLPQNNDKPELAPQTAALNTCLNDKAVKIADNNLSFFKSKKERGSILEAETKSETTNTLSLNQFASASNVSNKFQTEFSTLPLFDIEKKLLKNEEANPLARSETTGSNGTEASTNVFLAKSSSSSYFAGTIAPPPTFGGAGDYVSSMGLSEKAENVDDLLTPNPLVLEILNEYRNKRVAKEIMPEKLQPPSETGFPEDRKNFAQIQLVYENPKLQDLTLDTLPAIQNNSIHSQSKFGNLSRVDSSEFRDQANSQLASFNEYSQDQLKREHIHEVYEDGSVYEGEKMNELRHGRGKFYYADGGMYDGEWKQGRMHGYGHLYYPSGEVAYEGEWREDKFNGKGIVYNESPVELKVEFDYTNFQSLGDHWKKYEGDFKDDNKDGIGTIFLSNGDRFTGRFLNDEVHGQGTYFRRDGRVITGKWEHNVIVYTY